MRMNNLLATGLQEGDGFSCDKYSARHILSVLLVTLTTLERKGEVKLNKFDRDRLNNLRELLESFIKDYEQKKIIKGA